MKNGFLVAFFITTISAMVWSGVADEPAITQAELVRRSQELFDSVAPGNAEPFKKYFAEDAMFFDEKGRSMDKAALVKDIQPMPRGYSGTIKLVRPKSHIESNVAILSYDLDETEAIFGQNMTARYHETDTWMRRGASGRSSPDRCCAITKIQHQERQTPANSQLMLDCISWGQSGS
jgi:hypothetical protein